MTKKQNKLRERKGAWNSVWYSVWVGFVFVISLPLMILVMPFYYIGEWLKKEENKD